MRSWTAHSDGVKAIAHSGDNRIVVSGGAPTLKVWEASTGRLLQTLRLGESQPSEIRSLQISSDNQRLAVATGRTIQLWNIGTGQLIKVAVSTTAQNQAIFGSSLPQAMAFSPDGQTLISRDANQLVLFWNLNTFRSDRSISVASGNAPDPVDTSDAVATPQPIYPQP